MNKDQKYFNANTQIKVNNLNVTIIHNIEAPYRIPLFKKIGEKCKLTVIFYSKDNIRIRGINASKKAEYNSIFLENFKLGVFIINPGILLCLLKVKTDIYLISDNEENIFSNLLVVLVSKLRRKPYVLWTGHIPIKAGTTHPIDLHKSLAHKWPIKNIYAFFIKFCNQILYRHAKSFLAYSEKTKQYLLDYNISPNKILVGTQAMSPSLLPKVSKKFALDHKKLQILYLGYLRPEKGVDVLIKAASELPSSRFQLHVVGEGPKKAYLQKLANDNKDIVFHKYARSQQRAKWYISVDILVLPTYYDPWAHVITESLYYGTPVIVTKNAGVSSIINNGKNGHVVRSGDVQTIVRLLKKYIDNPGLLTKMERFVKSNKNDRIYDVSSDAKIFLSAINLAYSPVNSQSSDNNKLLITH